jgi:hypothetical protein
VKPIVYHTLKSLKHFGCLDECPDIKIILLNTVV